MNMWAAYPAFIEYLEGGFAEFLQKADGDPLKREYLLPNIIDMLIQQKRAKVKVFKTSDRWFGVTYKEDKEAVEAAFHQLIKEGVYPADLWGGKEN